MTDHEKDFVDKLLNAALSRYSATEPRSGLEDRLLAALRAARADDSVDGLLDAGLARYSQAAPRPGLENRLLAGLRDAPQPSRWLDWRWAGALATAAVALLVLAFFWMQGRPLPEPPPPAVAHVPAPAPTPTRRETAQPPRVARATIRRTVPKVETARAEAPRLETFPALAPLSEQERLLLLFVRQTPREATLVAQARSQPTGPLGVAPLRPLEGLVKKTEENN